MVPVSITSKSTDSDFIGNINKIKKVTRWLVQDMIEDAYSSQYVDGDEEWFNLIADSKEGDDARILRTIAEVKEHRVMVENMIEEQVNSIEDIISMYNNLLETKKEILLKTKVEILPNKLEEF